MSEPFCGYTEDDCCRNGCANCVLNQNIQQQRKSNLSDRSGKTNVLGEYRKYKLLERTQLLPFIFQLLFRLAETEQLTEGILDCPPGHHIMMRSPDPDEDDDTETKYVLRPYTPFWLDCDTFEFKILINTKPQGKMTKYIEQLDVNDEVEFRGPIGSYKHKPSNQPGHKLLIYTQGVAIAAAIPIIEHILVNGDDLTKIYHSMCYEDLNSIIFRSEISSYNQFWNYLGKIYLARPFSGDVKDDSASLQGKLKHNEKIYLRRMGKEDIQNEIKALGNEEIEAVVSGAKSFQDFVVDVLQSCDIDTKCIHVL